MYVVYLLKDLQDNEKFVVYGRNDKIEDYLEKRPLYQKIYGSGSTYDSYQEANKIVIELSSKYPGIEIIELGN